MGGGGDSSTMSLLLYDRPGKGQTDSKVKGKDTADLYSLFTIPLAAKGPIKEALVHTVKSPSQTVRFTFCSVSSKLYLLVSRNSDVLMQHTTL